MIVEDTGCFGAYILAIAGTNDQVPLYPDAPHGLRALTMRASTSGEVLLDLVIASDVAPAWLAGLRDSVMALDEVVGLSWSAPT